MKRVLNAFRQIKFKDLLAPFIFLILLIPSFVFRLINKAKHRKLWLVAEQGGARDNGYHFYKYIRTNHHADFCFYAIKKDSTEYDKVAELGNVVKWGSLKHWLYYMSANLNISSQKSGNPCPIFWYIVHVAFGLYKNRVFLQHGVTHNNAKWIYYKKTRFKYFVCATKKEYDFVLSKFGYRKENLLLTGFPRWDSLKDTSNNQKQCSILIMPTWRNWLGGDRNKLSKIDHFEKTSYFIEWNELLSSKKFIDYLEKNNIVVYFYPHINMMQFLDSFRAMSKNIKIISSSQDIQDYFNKCNLMITDYSSVAFDFAFLNKPVVYYQFDQKEYRAKQYGEGSFSYEKNGFGPLAKNSADAIRLIKKMLDHKDYSYKKRIEDYFGDEKKQFSEELYYALTGERKKKKILQVVNCMNIGGIETFILNLYKNIDRDKYEFIFLTNKPGKYDYQESVEKMGGKFIRINTTDSGLKRRLLHLQQLNKVMRREKPDVVHCYTYFDAASVMTVAKHNKIPIRITHSHTAQGFMLGRNYLHTLLAWLIRKKSTVMLSCGPDAGLALYKKPVFTILNNGIDLNSFKFDNEKRNKIRKEIGLKETDIVIGHIGRLADVKNHSFIIRIAQYLKEKGLNEYKFVFVGDGPLMQQLQNDVNKKKVQENVIFLGGRSDVSDLYNAFDLFLFPSIYEGLPMALIEAQANGLPIIASSSIDKSTKINSNFKFIDLEDDIKDWINAIKKYHNKRISPKKNLEKYSILNTVKEIEKLYAGGEK